MGQGENRPDFRTRSAAALANACSEDVKLADHISGAVACMPREAIQAPRAGAPLQYVPDRGHDQTILTTRWMRGTGPWSRPTRADRTVVESHTRFAFGNISETPRETRGEINGDPGGMRFGVDIHELTTRVPSCGSFCF